MNRRLSFVLAVLSTTFAAACPAVDLAPPTAVPTRLDVAQAPAPLFDDPLFHGATDPFVIWNPVKGEWFMYYTQRRATMPAPNGVDWVHGTAIGIATSKDGTHWGYLGTCQGDHDLSEPIKASGGLGPEPGVTWWAPCYVYEGNTFHMFVTLVDGIYTRWTGHRNILHFTSTDGVTWKYLNTCQLHSERVIDPTVYRINDTWHMVYKDEGAGSHTFRSESKDMVEWSHGVPVNSDVGQEAPFVFRWLGKWWLIVDALGNKGLRVYQSPDGLDGWTYNHTLLGEKDGTRSKDDNVGHHPGIVLQTAADGREQCLMFYFTHQRNQSVIQLAEMNWARTAKSFATAINTLQLLWRVTKAFPGLARGKTLCPPERSVTQSKDLSIHARSWPPCVATALKETVE